VDIHVKEEVKLKVQKSIEIAAPPAKIWPFMVEPEKILQWIITFQKFEYTAEKCSGVGTPFYVEEKAGGPLMKINFVVTEWVENERLAARMISGNMVKSYELRFTLESTPSGSRFTFLETTELPFGIIGKLIGAIGKRTAESHLKQCLAKLKSLVET
jgi:uncharacterized protein YndB with AHSA1/START domain